jgi:tetratricopeptide (TPR) repeat protein
LLAKAWAPSDGRKAEEALNTALSLNPKHVESLLFQADRLIDAEEYDDAGALLEEVFAVNSQSPEAWALKAAIAHLRGQFEEEGKYRAQALDSWERNPHVDYLIGKNPLATLSIYRGYSLSAPGFEVRSKLSPAQFQLAQDLLRTGQTDEGWELVELVSSRDRYNVTAYNLRALRDRLEQFATLQRDGIVVAWNRRRRTFMATGY